MKTDVGPLYKIGFTTFASVEDCFAFKGDGDEALIDKTLLVVRLENAYDVEQRLHALLSVERMFRAYSRISYMPLYLNGQSELYARDVLKLDDEFTEAQETSTREQVKRRYGEEQVPLSPKYQALDAVAKGIGTALAWGIVIPISKLFFRESERREREEREREEANRLRRLDALIAMLRERRRLQQS